MHLGACMLAARRDNGRLVALKPTANRDEVGEACVMRAPSSAMINWPSGMLTSTTMHRPASRV
jgi:hypothetical protein